ncbi:MULTISPECIES: hypothetical protein [Paenibacillus]|jgi:hypothetical protein|uniref:Uncharacterized protein n=1 Tax=Paenibacillus residui TaxID=629724 RepID=A0ABW3DB69_9BACL|nr:MULTISPECIES: hypothetical protein [Paenibacillaceae]
MTGRLMKKELSADLVFRSGNTSAWKSEEQLARELAAWVAGVLSKYPDPEETRTERRGRDYFLELSSLPLCKSGQKEGERK